MEMPAGGSWLLALVGLLALTHGGPAAAEPPLRAARLAYVNGTVSFSPAGQPDWVQAVANRPLTSGDRLWTDPGARAELQVGGAALRLGAATSVTLLNLDDRIAQLQLSQGTLKLRVRRLGSNQVFEVDTPNLAFTMRRAGDYRIDVDANGDATAVTVRSGQGEVYGEGASYTVTPKVGYRFYGTGLSDYDRITGVGDDAFDRWARTRDRRYDNSASARYVSSDVVGYQDLDASGAWRVEPEYGNVWTPARVATGWTPYRDGHWAWIDPWGWTWVDDAPWGYAVSHYGRWANIRGRWSWVPGPPRERAVYAPALVAFVGGNNDHSVASSVGGAIAAAVGWFPLAPREVFQPAYPVSRGYFNNINRSNAVIAPAAITNIYNSTTINNTTIVNNTTTNVTKVVYVNQRVTGAVVAVPAQVFVRSRPVAGAALQLSTDAVASAPVAHVAAVAPLRESVHGGARDATARPPSRERGIVARTAPPPPPLDFAAQQQQLAATPGRPIGEAERKRMKPVVPAMPSPALSVVTTAQAPAPSAPPPVTAPAGKSPEARKAEATRNEPGKADSRRGETDKAADTRAEASKVEAAKVEAAKAESLKAEGLKADAAKAAMGKAETTKAEAAKVEATKTEAIKAEAARAEAARVASVKAEASKAEASKTEAAKSEAAKVEAARLETARAEAARVANAKAEASRVEAARAEAAKADAARQDAAKAAAGRVAAAKGEADKAEAAKAAKAEATKAEAARAEAARVSSNKAEASKAEAAKLEAARIEAARADAARVANVKAEASMVEAARSEAAKVDAARQNAAKAAAGRAAAAKAEADRAEAAKAESARIEAVKADAARVAAVNAEAARVSAMKAEASRAEAAKAGARRAEAARSAAAKEDVSKEDAARGDATSSEAPRANAPRGDAAKSQDERRRGEEEARRR